MKRSSLFLILISFISSCHKDKITDLPTGKGVYIINEGNFNFGNGEVSFYDPNANAVTNNLFQSANGYILGDVAQSMFVKDSIAFIVVNNSAKIELVKLPSFQKIRTITISGSSPRNILPLNDSIAYVTELFAKKIWVLNYITGNVVITITTQGWTENLFKIGNDVFVQQKINSTLTSTFATLLKVNTTNHTTQYNNTFEGRDVIGIVKDKLNRIWVAVDEDTAHSLYAGFYCFDRNLVVQKSFFYSSYSHHPSRLCINSSGEKIVYADKDVFSFTLDENVVPVNPVISSSGKNIYAMDIDPANDDIYISDALDFVQQSRIYRYDKSGTLIHSFTAGIISGNFAFNHE